jgi:hypothetical protein
MLSRLPYFNVVFAILYFLFYLLNGWSYALAGVLLTIIFSFAMLSITEGKLKVSIFTYLTGSLSLLFAVFLMIWSFNIFAASLKHGYLADSWFYMLFSTLFAVAITSQFISMFIKKDN